ncbi:hypothetical protein BMR08_01990 [Methylococcaceae bacterium CS2]|nr:hypothetical protein BMR08_01990 [Methylococcaceae bacterium CS2]
MRVSDYKVYKTENYKKKFFVIASFILGFLLFSMCLSCEEFLGLIKNLGVGQDNRIPPLK